MNKPAKVAIGIASILPLFYVAIFILFFISLTTTINHQQHQNGPPDFFFILFTVHVLVMLLNFALIVFYIINIFINERVAGDRKILWAVVIFLGNMLAYPFYWYFYIWKEPGTVYANPAEDNASTNGKIYCRKCGTQNEDFRYKCTNCGDLLHPVPQGSSGRIDYKSLGGVFPYRNTSAISAYYLGVFSAIPPIGIFLGIAAFFLGLKGRRIALEHPERKGTAHAWAGILLGGFFGLGYLVGLIILLVKLSGNG